ncbi:MAG TPA: hypothetical protein VEU52_03910 [Candidatus Limnocylindrales bacterium]|nr:hypothetical protein [Candidatus Limnocylindrales bacterium]
MNLIFVVSEDLAFQAPGDINPVTANLTNRGLQRALLMGKFLQQQVLGGTNVTAIYALEPMTHLQSENNYPDLVPLETIQQFAMLNQTTITYQGSSTTANSFPVFSSYSEESVPVGVAKPAFPCNACVGLDFQDKQGDNETLVGGIVTANAPGFYVFSAPWEIASVLMTDINQLEGSNLTLPSRYAGPNVVYAIAVTPSGNASLLTYNSNLNPPSNYPVLPTLGIVTSQCTATPFEIQVTGGIGGAIAPNNSNTNETVYMIRHAEAHPNSTWDDGNYVGPGQWRALELPYALLDKIHPTEVYSIDASNAIPGGQGSIPSSYIRPTLTAEPYAIANNLPFNFAASVAVFSQNPPALSTLASNFFFTNGTFTNKTILVAWEHDHIPPTINALISSYQPPPSRIAPNWSDSDYDTIWTVKLDGQGNLTVDNSLCEGIDSASLPATPPPF